MQYIYLDIRRAKKRYLKLGRLPYDLDCLSDPNQ